MEWLLTKEERGQVYDSLSDEATEGEARVALCIAQAKKMAEYLSQHNTLAHLASLYIGHDKWQALRKEVGLE